VRTTGIKAIKIDQGDELIDVQVTSGSNDIVLATRHGLSVRFHEMDVREMGRDTTGVKGVELREGDSVIGMVVVKRDATLLVVTERGLGKCSNIADYRVQKRGGKGIHGQQNRKTGDVVALGVLPADEVSHHKHGVIIPTDSSQVRVTGRIAQGVKSVSTTAIVTAVARCA
jgi:DNA gyrase subunit A